MNLAECLKLLRKLNLLFKKKPTRKKDRKRRKEGSLPAQVQWLSGELYQTLISHHLFQKT